MRACKPFFDYVHSTYSALAFDDVLLKPGLSLVPPDHVSLETQFSRRVGLKIPIVSSPMDTVTKSKMAIAMAEQGGLGIIHRNLSPEEQRDEVRRVKFHLSGKISKPFTVKGSMTLEEVENMRIARRLRFHTFPVLGVKGELIGLITQNDFDFCDNRSKLVSDIMTPFASLITAPPHTTITEAYRVMQEAKRKVLPLVEDGCLMGMYLHSDLKRIKSASVGSLMLNVDQDNRLRVGAAVGVGEEAMERVGLLMEESTHVDVIVLDAAHAHTVDAFRTVRDIKSKYDIDVMGGNISTGEAAAYLINAGADGIRLGQGPGSICTTRIVAGYGRAQLSAIYDVVDAIEHLPEDERVPVCADGGITKSGDISKAIGAGAHSVMLGGLLAGTDETPGEVDERSGTPKKPYRGMGSRSAMLESHGSRERYKQGENAIEKLVPEGVERDVPYVGKLEHRLIQLLGGLRSGMGGVGAGTIGELRNQATFDRISQAGIKESHPHEIQTMEPSIFGRWGG